LEVFAKNKTTNIAKAPKTAKPITKGTTVPLYDRPIYTPNGTEINVDTEPTIAAPIPAIWPNGSIANEFKLPKSIPVQKTVAHK